MMDWTTVKPKIITRRAKRQEDDMESPIEYPNFHWAPRRSQDYMKVKVFQDQVYPMMTAKAKEKFKTIQKMDK